MEKYTLKHIKEYTSLTERQILHFADIGLVIPVIPAARSGGRRIYSKSNLEEFRLVKKLWDSGLSIGSIKRVMCQRLNIEDLSKRVDKFCEAYEALFAN